MSEPVLPPEIVEFYAHDFDEAARIRDGFDSLELVRTQEVIRRHLPTGRLRILAHRTDLGEHRADLPELRKELMADQSAEDVHGRALGSNDLMTDDARGDLVVTGAPQRDAFVPFDQGFRESVERRIWRPAVEPDQVDLACGQQLGKRVVELAAQPLRIAPAGRFEARPTAGLGRKAATGGRHESWWKICTAADFRSGCPEAKPAL